MTSFLEPFFNINLLWYIPAMLFFSWFSLIACFMATDATISHYYLARWLGKDIPTSAKDAFGKPITYRDINFSTWPFQLLGFVVVLTVWHFGASWLSAQAGISFSSTAVLSWAIGFIAFALFLVMKDDPENAWPWQVVLLAIAIGGFFGFVVYGVLNVI